MNMYSIRCECSLQKCAGETEALHKLSCCFSVIAYKSASHFEVSTVFSKSESESQLHRNWQPDTVNSNTESAMIILHTYSIYFFMCSSVFKWNHMG